MLQRQARCPLDEFGQRRRFDRLGPLEDLREYRVVDKIVIEPGSVSEQVPDRDWFSGRCEQRGVRRPAGEDLHLLKLG